MDLGSTVLRQRVSKLKKVSTLLTEGPWSLLLRFQGHINQITNLQCVKLHVGIPVGQPLDHGGNGFFRTTSSRMAISKVSLWRALSHGIPHTLIPLSQLCHRHPISEHQVSFTVYSSATIRYRVMQLTIIYSQFSEVRFSSVALAT